MLSCFGSSKSRGAASGEAQPQGRTPRRNFARGHGSLVPTAFTLIELLVVLAIIAMLISILAPALGRARETGRRTMCGNNLRQVGASFWNYSNDYENWFPSKPWCGNAGAGVAQLAQHQQGYCGMGPQEPDFFATHFAGMIRDILERDYIRGEAEAPKYLRDPKILVCPSDDLGNGYLTDALFPIKAVADVRDIQPLISSRGQKEKNYSYLYVSLLRNDDRADMFMMGDESNKQDVATDSMTQLTTEDNHGRRGINALFVDMHVEWAGVRGGDFASLQQLAWKLWAPTCVAPARFPVTNGTRNTEVQTID
jgi:prepilin-type N-terminal cleavage/methylation domain-containing protein